MLRAASDLRVACRRVRRDGASASIRAAIFAGSHGRQGRHALPLSLRLKCPAHCPVGLPTRSGYSHCAEASGSPSSRCAAAMQIPCTPRSRPWPTTRARAARDVASLSIRPLGPIPPGRYHPSACPMIPFGETAPAITPPGPAARMPIGLPFDQSPVTSTSWPRRPSSASTSLAIRPSATMRPG